MLRQQRLRSWRAIIAYMTQRRRQEAQQESAVSTCNATVLGDVLLRHCQVVGDDIVTRQQQALSGGDFYRPDA